jgi:hypothetical protein
MKNSHYPFVLERHSDWDYRIRFDDGQVIKFTDAAKAQKYFSDLIRLEFPHAYGLCGTDKPKTTET